MVAGVEWLCLIEVAAKSNKPKNTANRLANKTAENGLLNHANS